MTRAILRRSNLGQGNDENNKGNKYKSTSNKKKNDAASIVANNKKAVLGWLGFLMAAVYLIRVELYTSTLSVEKEKEKKKEMAINAPPYVTKADLGVTYWGGRLPQHLVTIGDEVYGSRENFEKALLEHATPQKIPIAGYNVVMTSAKADDTLPRLQSDYQRGDPYGILQVKQPRGMIIDIGSNIGDFAIAAWLIHSGMQIVAVEPSPHTYFFLMLNLHMNNVPILSEKDLGNFETPGVFAVNAAVTSDGRNVTIKWSNTLSQNAALGSTETANEGTTDWSSAVIPSLQMETFFSSHGIGSVELFKIDCEGCEFEVIPSMKSWIGNRAKVKILAGEFHQSLKEPNTPTMAEKPTKTQIAETDAALAQRGCKTNQWSVIC